MIRYNLFFFYPEEWKTRKFNDILFRHSNAVYNQNTIDRWTKGYILPFPKKGDLRIAKKCWGITLTSIVTKIYNALLHNCIEPKIEKILRKNQNGFRKNRFTTSQRCTCQKPCSNNIIHQLLQGIWLHTQREDGANTSQLQTTQIVAAIMILYKNTKVKVCFPDRDTDYFDIIAGMLQGDTLAPYLFIICLDYVFRTSIDLMKENGFKLAKERSRRYPTQTIMDADYTNDIALLANTPAQAESLRHSLEWAASGIGLHVNTHKTEYMCFNQRGNISTLKGGHLKLVDKFT